MNIYIWIHWVNTYFKKISHIYIIYFSKSITPKGKISTILTHAPEATRCLSVNKYVGPIVLKLYRVSSFRYQSHPGRCSQRWCKRPSWCKYC